jgi:U4/U6 small nuclear ribonucleoprotein PRP31
LGEKDLSNCLSACSEIMALHEDKVLILRFVESRMSALAPNLCALIGSRIAAQLIGIAGRKAIHSLLILWHRGWRIPLIQYFS